MQNIIQQAAELFSAMQATPRYRDTVPENLVHVYALLHSLAATDNAYRVTNIFGGKFLSKDCYGFLMETVDCDPEELDSYIGFLEDNDLISIDDISAFDGEDYIAVKEVPILDNDNE